MRCVDVAALFAAAILRRNPDSVVIPFDQSAYKAKIEASDTILSIAERLARYGGGGTDCSLPLKAAVEWFPNRKFAGAVIVSDNESWLGTGRYGSTATMTAWGSFLANQRKLAGKDARPKLINIDLQPYQTTQTLESPDIINIGGFSDSVFNVVSAFLSDNKNRFVSEVEAMEI
jgi:60 kDa SS-A/Ro ribonucleoprotein